jgi:putative Mg2+ transporter-C (MgtC) family protein
MNSWDWTTFIDHAMRIGAAALLGGVVGLEREWSGHWAGLRTHMMVAVGSAIFVITGLLISGEHASDVTRVIQGVAAGIGFLGAGTILKLGEQKEIKGLTTASSIWLASALGVVAGLAEYALAAAVTCVSIFILAVLRPIEKLLERQQAVHRLKNNKSNREANKPLD